MAPSSEPAALCDVVALMARADWTKLSLSATLTVRTIREPELPGRETSYRVLLAPGGKYRISPAGPGQVLEVCDGETAWIIVSGQPWEAGADAEGHPPLPPRRAVRRPAAGPGSPFEELLIPASLLSRYTLEPGRAAGEGSMGASGAGTESVGGRAAHRVVARPRLIADRRPERRPDQVIAHVDAELGTLLRYEESFDGQPLEVIELSGVRFDPPRAPDPGQFQPPPGVPVADAQIPFRGPGVSLPGLGVTRCGPPRPPLGLPSATGPRRGERLAMRRPGGCRAATGPRPGGWSPRTMT